MALTVTANTPMTISHKGSNGISMSFPDVCKTPSPAGPVPIPYPNVAKSSDLIQGSTTVKVDKNSAALKPSKFSMSTGDEAGAALGVVSSKIKGMLQFLSYSFDVKFEGKNVCRLADPAQQNMGSGNTVGPFHAQAPKMAIPKYQPACDEIQKDVKKQKKKGPATQWKDSGIVKKHQAPIKNIAKKENWIIYFRASGRHCMRWIKKGHLPKPHACLQAKSIDGDNKKIVQDWLDKHFRQLAVATGPDGKIGSMVKSMTTNAAGLEKSNLFYTPHARDFYGTVADTTPGPDYGRPMRGIEKAKHAVNDSKLPYLDKWMTGDYDLMDVIANDWGCCRVCQDGPGYARLQRTLNKALKWDAIQHGPQAQWCPSTDAGDEVDASFPDAIQKWLAKPGYQDPGKVTVTKEGRQLRTCDNLLTVVGPDTVFSMTDYEKVKKTLQCNGCVSPGAEVEPKVKE